MTDLAIRITITLNALANTIGEYLLAPIGRLPDYTGAVLVSLVTGIVMLIAFKHTSPQSTIKRIRNQTKAELLSLSLFKDSIAVSLAAQGRIFWKAIQSILVTFIPIAVMIIPVTLLLGQLSLWWQFRPLRVGEEAVVTLNLNGNDKTAWPDVQLASSSAFEPSVGPVRVKSQRAIHWNLVAKEAGYHQLSFEVDGKTIKKQLAVGQQLMRVSERRPAWKWSDIVLYPAEEPFPIASAVKSIEIQYPGHESWLTGSKTWLIAWFLGSTITALCFRGVFNVNL